MARARVGIEAPWRWLQQSVALMRRHPRTLAGAAVLLILMALVPTMVQLLLALLLPAQAGAAWLQGLGFALSLLIYPPAVGGFNRVVHGLDAGESPLPSALLATYADGPAARRMIIANLLCVALTLLTISLLTWLLHGEALMHYVEQLAALKPGTTQLPSLPSGTLPLLVALLLAGVALFSAQGLASVEVALGTRQPLAAVAAAFAATARNYAVLLLFYLPLAVFSFLVFMLVALVAALAGMLLSVLSPVLATLVVLPLSLLLVLVLYALLFTFYYYAWRELFDTAPAPPPAPHVIAA